MGYEPPENLQLRNYDNSNFYFIETLKQVEEYHDYVKKKYKNDNSTIRLTLKQNDHLQSELPKNTPYHLLFIGAKKVPALLMKRDNNETATQKPLLVFYHGNAENIYNILGDFFWINIFRYYDILTPELPGYASNNRGDFSKETRDEQTEEILKWCNDNYPDNFIVMGHSLGCHFAILLAKQARNSCRHLVLANPFLTDKDAAKHVVGCGGCCTCCGACLTKPIYRKKLDNSEEIKDVNCDIDFYYSCKDKVINPGDAEKLYNVAKENSNNRELTLLPIYYSNDLDDDNKEFYIPLNYYYLPIKNLQKFKDMGYCFDTGHGDAFHYTATPKIRLFEISKQIKMFP